MHTPRLASPGSLSHTVLWCLSCPFGVPLAPVLPGQAFGCPRVKVTFVSWGIWGCSWEDHPRVQAGAGYPGCHPPPPSMIWGMGAPQGPALCPGPSMGGTTGSTHPSTLAASTQPSGHPDYPPPVAAGLVRPQHGGEGGGSTLPSLSSGARPLPLHRSCAADGLEGAPAWRKAQRPEGGAVPAGGPGRLRPEGPGTSPARKNRGPSSEHAVAPAVRTAEGWNNSPRAGARHALSKGPSSARPPWGWGAGEGPARPVGERGAGPRLQGTGCAQPGARTVPPCHPGPGLGPWGGWVYPRARPKWR